MKKSIVIFTLSLVIIFCCLNGISASTDNNTIINNHTSPVLTNTNNISDYNISDNNIKQDKSSLSLNQSENPDYYTLNSSNFHDYFDDNNKLKPEYGGKIIVFQENLKI